MTKGLCSSFHRIQPFLFTNKLCYFCSKSFLKPLLFQLCDMQLHYIVSLWKGQKNEELQVPFYRTVLVRAKH